MSEAIAVVLFGPEGQGGFNHAGLAGAERARTKTQERIAVQWCAAPDTAGRAAFLRKLATAGARRIIAHGGQGDAPVAAMAHEFPDAQFAITQGDYLAANVACYEVLQEESAFLAGVLAATHTQTGVVAHLSGERVRPGLKGRAAFADGVRQQNPDVKLLTTFCGNQHDAELAYRTVCAQAAHGVDVLFAMIDGGRSGAIRACREHRVAQIGNVIDWTAREPDVFIASALADSGYCVEAAVEDFLAGRLPRGEKRVFGLAASAHVRLALGSQVSQAARAVLADWETRLGKRLFTPLAEYGGEEFYVA
jgi:basic membrane protein A and related proteins